MLLTSEMVLLHDMAFKTYVRLKLYAVTVVAKPLAQCINMDPPFLI